MTHNNTNSDTSQKSNQVQSGEREDRSEPDKTVASDNPDSNSSTENVNISPERAGELHRRLLEVSSEITSAESHLSLIAQNIGVAHREDRHEQLEEDISTELDQFINQLDKAAASIDELRSKAYQITSEGNVDDESVLSDDYLVKNT